MRITINHTELYFDVEGPELTIADGRLERKPTMVVLHGGPGFDQGYLRPGLRALASDAQLVFVDLRGQGRSAAAPLDRARSSRWPTTSSPYARRWASSGRSSSVTPPAGSWRSSSRCAIPARRPG